MQPNWISCDPTACIADEYERLTGRLLNRERIKILTGVLRLSELGGFADQPERIPEAARVVAEWEAYQEKRGADGAQLNTITKLVRRNPGLCRFPPRSKIRNG